MNLPWREVEPRTHPFDVELVRPLLEAVVAENAQALRRPVAERPRIWELLDAPIVATYGNWAQGWRWDGGPIGPEEEPVVRRGPVAYALASLTALRRYLELLEVAFASLRIETAGLEPAHEVERAAARLVALAAEWTDGEDAWYRTFSRSLAWYLEASGFSDADARREIERIAEGQFRSWVLPEAGAAAAGCARIGEAAAGLAVQSPRPRDALSDWLIVRAAPVARPARERTPAGSDAHVEYIATHDRTRDSERADRLEAALLLVRDSAQRGQPLSFDQLAEWQRIVLGARAPVPFRTTDAFAKQGRERYRTIELEVFEAALAEAGDLGTDVATRAARVYLDVCFFHPFPDGNARAARLALEHVVSSAGLRLGAVIPIFSVSRSADDTHGVWGLAAVIDRALTNP